MVDHRARTPGQLIEQLLSQKGWSQRVLAVVLGVGDSGINKLIAGKKPMTGDMAVKLGEVFGVDAENFMRLQADYDLAQARIVARPDPGRETRAHLFGGLPIADMIKRGWIKADKVTDVAQVESELSRFFEVASVDEIEILPHAAKKTNVTGGVTAPQLAWLYRVRRIAKGMVVGRFSSTALSGALERLRALLFSAEEARKVPQILADAGIRFVVVESLPSAKIDGVCFWLDDSAPVIGMSIRHDRVDNFWFVLRHELEHVLRGDGKGAMMLDTELEGARAGTGADLPDEERAANEAAAEFCVPQAELARFIARKDPFFAERDLLGFSKTIRVHAGLVAGQLQHKTGRYDRFRAHQVKIRSIIAPVAVMDGWGDVAPMDV